MSGMADIQYSKHARDVLRERNISEEWVMRALSSPEQTDTRADGTTHYITAIPEHGGRFLRVVVNPIATPMRVVAVFFDR
jgi:uncharacterized protein DUF4258